MVNTVGPRSWLDDVSSQLGLQSLEPVFQGVEDLRQRAIGAVPQPTMPSVRSSLPQLSALIGPTQQPQQPETMQAPPQVTAPDPKGFLAGIPGLNDLMSLGQQLAPETRTTASPSPAADPARTDTTSPAAGIAPTRPVASGGAPAAMPQASAQSSGTGSPNVERWSPIIAEAARAYNVPEAYIKGLMEIESGGDPEAVSSQGAQSLMQVMPFHFQPGENPKDPRTNIFRGAKVYADALARYGDPEKAAAAYFGAIDANGNITGATDATGTDGQKYVALWRAAASKYGGASPNAGAAPVPAAPAAPPAPPASSSPSPSAAAGSGAPSGMYTVRDQWGNTFTMTPEAFRKRPGGTADLTVLSTPQESAQGDSLRMALGQPQPMPGSQGPYDQEPPALPASQTVPGPVPPDRSTEAGLQMMPGVAAPGLAPPGRLNDVPDDAIYRQPLVPTMGDTATGEYVDPDSGPRELGYSVPTEPATYGDAGDEPQVPYTPPIQGPPLSEAGPEQPPSAIDAIQNARSGMANDQELAPRENPLAAATAPAREVYGRAVDEVNQQEDEVQRRNEEVITSELGRTLTAPVETIRRGVRLATAIVQATPEATTVELDAALSQFGLGKDQIGTDLPIVGRVGIADAVLTLAPNKYVQGVMAAGMPIAHAPGMNAEFGQGVAGALERGTGALVNAGREAVSGLGSRIGEGLAQNAERSLPEGVQHLGSGFVPDEFGRPYPDIRRDVRGAVRESLGEPSSEMLADSRYPRDVVHPDLRAEGIGPEITPQVDVSSRLNSGAGPVSGSGIMPTLGNAAQGAFVGAASEDLQAQQEGRDPDPTQRLARAAAGAGLAILAGRAMRGGERQRLGSGVVPNGGRRLGLPGFESIDPLTDPVIPPTTRTTVPQNTMREALPDLVRRLQPTREPQITAAAGEATALHLPTLDQPPNILRRVRDAAQPWVDRVNILRYAGMLSDTAGQIFNLQSNVALAARDVALTPIAAALDVGRVGALRAAGQQADRQIFFGEVPQRVAGMRAGARVGLRPALEILRSGMTAEQAGKLTDQSAAIGFRSGSGIVDFAAEAPLRALAASDAVFRSSATGGHLMAEAYAAAKRLNRGQEPTAEMVREAAKNPDLLERVQKLAARSVLQEDRAMTTAYQKFIRDAGPLGLPIQVEVPFVKTPYNVMAQGMGMTPVGLAGLIQDVRAGRSAREMEYRLANVALGTAVMAGAASSVAAGEWTGPYPTDAKERSTLPPGWRPWSRKVEVGGETYYLPVISAMGPLGLPIVASILANEAEKSGKSRLSPEWAGALALGVGRYAAQNSFFEGVANIAKVMDERQGGSATEQQVEQIASQFSPHIIGGGALGREIQRIMGMPARDPEGALEALLATHPATAGMVEPAQDVLGRPRSMGISGPAGAAIRGGVEDDASVIRAFRRAGEGLPTAAPRSIRDPGANRLVTLTPSQRHRWRTIFGSELRSAWSNAGNPSDQKTLQGIESRAREAADATLLGRR